MRSTLACLLTILTAACSNEVGPGMSLRDASVYAARDSGPGPDAGDAGATGDAGAGSDASVCGPARLESFDINSAIHTADPVYGDPPPVGGPHTSCWLDYGAYEAPLDPGRWVHNLEHGAVVLLYRCDDGCDEVVEALTAFTGDHPRTILAPDPELPWPGFAALAWGQRLRMECLDLALLERFYAEYFNQAPEDIASGAPLGC